MTGVTVTLCTFRRPGVADTLRSIAAQDLPADTDMRIVVADNDVEPSGRAVVEETAADLSVPVRYVHAPARNISLARNACLDAATGDWVAFLDDDEEADPGWLAKLLATAGETDADAVFGPSLASYAPETPEWMKSQDHHSNRPVRRGDTVETGHTCNALLRWRGMPWEDERFDLARGRTGGEDTEFFFRLQRAGARFAICEDAIVRETVAPGRATFRWLARRKFRSGQSHAARAVGVRGRIGLALSAMAKAALCGALTLGYAWSEDRRNFWALRGALHLGVIAGCLKLPEPEIYGKT